MIERWWYNKKKFCPELRYRFPELSVLSRAQILLRTIQARGARACALTKQSGTVCGTLPPSSAFSVHCVRVL